VGDVVDDVQARHAVAAEQVDRVGFLLTEQRHQHIEAGDLLLAGGLDVEHRALQHPLEPQGRLHVGLLGVDERRGLADEVAELAPQAIEAGAAGLQHVADARHVQQREQQVLDGDELVALRARLLEGGVEAVFQFLAQHGL